MRSFLFTLLSAALLLAAPVSATTVTLRTTLSHITTDWTPFQVITGNTIRLDGSEIFEGHDYLDMFGDRFVVPQFDAAHGPADWIHVSHDLTFSVTGTGNDGTSGGFSVQIGNQGPMIAFGGYRHGDATGSFGRLRSVGAVALESVDFAALFTGARRSYFHIHGGAATYHQATLPTSRSIDRSFLDLWRYTYLDATLSGSVTLTAGFGGAPEPTLRAAVRTLSPVPLPATGLLLLTVLLGGAGVARRAARRAG